MFSVSVSLCIGTSVMIGYYHNFSGDLKNDVTVAMWQKLRTDEAPPWMWGYASFPTLLDFSLYINDPSRYFFISFTHDTLENKLKLHGIIWLDECIATVRARTHMYFFRDARLGSVNILVECQEFLRAVAAPPLSLDTLFFFTDAKASGLLNFAQKRIGITYLPSSIPGYYPGGAMIRFGYLSLEEYKNREGEK